MNASPASCKLIKQFTEGESCITALDVDIDGRVVVVGDINGEIHGYLTGLATNSIYFCFLFCENSLICLEGKSMTPHRGNSILFRSSQQLPRLRLGPSTRLVRCFRKYRDTRTLSGVELSLELS